MLSLPSGRPAFLPPPLLALPSRPRNPATSPRAALTVVERTQAWAEDVVVALNLCPFAPPALARGAVRTVVSRARSAAALHRRVLQESRLLLASGVGDVETTLVVAPDCLGDFVDFNAFATAFQDELEAADAEVMLACFHPEHTYGDSFGGEEDPVNFDKRAPFPIVNILRTAAVDDAVADGLTDGILDRNADTLERVGVQELRRIYEKLS